MEPQLPDSIERLLASSLGGTTTEAEMLELESWVNASPENRKIYFQFKRLWENSFSLEIDCSQALRSVMARLRRRERRITAWHFAQQAAAVLFIPLLASVLWLSTHRNIAPSLPHQRYFKTEAAFGTFASLELPDGSKVWLNSGSSIRYPENFGNSTRSVSLEGEAYFEVQSDKKHPFVVITPKLQVTATGTRFSVMAYEGEPYPSVTLLEGKVAVEKPGNAAVNGTTVWLKPNQSMRFDTLNGKITLESGDMYKHIAWKDGRLVFRNDALTDVAKRLSLQYNVDIEIVGEQLKQNRFRATFNNESVTSVLKLLKLTSPFDFREIDAKHLPDGSYTRKKIIIYSTEHTSKTSI